mmetsp:Transcript_34461/g.112190  ORF Transcript_34461/g.112190 Transcript_34461/m.112190 type:complete len:91 (-) Transcript_34461:1315-1587(-)
MRQLRCLLLRKFLVSVVERVAVAGAIAHSQPWPSRAILLAEGWEPTGVRSVHCQVLENLSSTQLMRPADLRGWVAFLGESSISRQLGQAL